MSFTLEVDPERSLGTITLSGAVDGEQILDALEGLFHHSTWRPGYATLWDGREITSLAVGPSDVDRIVRVLADARDDAGAGRSAWVVRDEMYGIVARLLALRAHQSGRERRSFSDLDQAQQWLGEKA